MFGQILWLWGWFSGWWWCWWCVVYCMERTKASPSNEDISIEMTPSPCWSLGIQTTPHTTTTTMKHTTSSSVSWQYHQLSPPILDESNSQLSSDWIRRQMSGDTWVKDNRHQKTVYSSDLCIFTSHTRQYGHPPLPSHTPDAIENPEPIQFQNSLDEPKWPFHVSKHFEWLILSPPVHHHNYPNCLTISYMTRIIHFYFFHKWLIGP